MLGNQLAVTSLDLGLLGVSSCTCRIVWDPHQGPVSRKSRELFGPEKPFVKLPPAFSVKLVFSYVVKGIKIKITAKFRASRLLRFEDTKRIMSPEIRPKSFGTFEKQASLWLVSRKSRKLFGPEKQFVKLRTANSAKLVFSYVVKGK